eukprot:281379-Prymnesium_polylepis.2
MTPCSVFHHGPQRKAGHKRHNARAGVRRAAPESNEIVGSRAGSRRAGRARARTVLADRAPHHRAAAVLHDLHPAVRARSAAVASGPHRIVEAANRRREPSPRSLRPAVLRRPLGFTHEAHDRRCAAVLVPHAQTAVLLALHPAGARRRAADESLPLCQLLQRCHKAARCKLLDEASVELALAAPAAHAVGARRADRALECARLDLEPAPPAPCAAPVSTPAIATREQRRDGLAADGALLLPHQR